ncbi:hypothetical protein H6G74_17695 [Nostoc spongiaeforme FACHB-130]|uniref:Uncharacterized protein n=1 Tax=Nostoc spongiaeforme FACHB-130 TaxID=1357510 RepID=A0ABR8FXJ8_9NOSO|nr:hypothetical protein [Nostoc spongiaeforme]MBD2596145.1 hypothetical protein [Nostoc spongiaeforme FACHB-130]
MDEVQFETFVSQNILIIPEAKRGCFTPVELGIRITNNTQASLHFSTNFYSMFPEMIAPGGELMRTGIYCARCNQPMASEFVVLIPGRAVTLYRDAFLFWEQKHIKKRDRHLSLYIPYPAEDIYCFYPLYPGTYQFRFRYREPPGAKEELPRWIETKKLQPILENLWIGEVLTPLVDIHLVDSSS